MQTNSASTNLQQTLARILSPHGRGGITDTKHMPILQSLLESQTELGPRQVLLTVLALSSDDVRTMVVKSNAIKTLEAWVVDAAEGRDGLKDPDARASLMSEVIKCLSMMPVDVEALRRTGIGRTFSKLPKQLGKDAVGEQTPVVVMACKGLVEQWKRLVEPAVSADTSKAGSANGSSNKRKQAEGGPTAKRPKPAESAAPGTEPAINKPADGASSAQDASAFMSTAAQDQDQGGSGSGSQDRPSQEDSQPLTQAGSDSLLRFDSMQSEGEVALPSAQQPAQPAQLVLMPESDAGSDEQQQQGEVAAQQEDPPQQPPVDLAPVQLPPSEQQGVQASRDMAVDSHATAASIPSANESNLGLAADTTVQQSAEQGGSTSDQNDSGTTIHSAGPSGIGSAAAGSDPAAAAAGSAAAGGTGEGGDAQPKPVRRVGPRPGGLQLSRLGRGGGAGDATRLGSLRDGTGGGRLGSLKSPLTSPSASPGGPAAAPSAAAQIASSEQRAAAMFGGLQAAAAAANDVLIAQAPIVSLPGRLTAPQRAAQAAMNVEAAISQDPELQRVSNKAKRKRVHWPEDNQLQNIRWFRKDDPPCKAAQDAVPTRPQAHANIGASSLTGIHAPGFERAARREHAGERAALQAQHEEEEKERSAMLGRLEDMHPTVPFTPPPMILISPDWNVAAGEESAERHLVAVKASQRPPVYYPSINHVPPTPTEAPPTADMPAEPQQHTVRIPLNALGAPLPTQHATPATLPPPPAVQQPPMVAAPPVATAAAPAAGAALQDALAALLKQASGGGLIAPSAKAPAAAPAAVSVAPGTSQPPATAAISSASLLSQVLAGAAATQQPPAADATKKNNPAAALAAVLSAALSNSGQALGSAGLGQQAVSRPPPATTTQLPASLLFPAPGHTAATTPVAPADAGSNQGSINSGALSALLASLSSQLNKDTGVAGRAGVPGDMPVFGTAAPAAGVGPGHVIGLPPGQLLPHQRPHPGTPSIPHVLPVTGFHGPPGASGVPRRVGAAGPGAGPASPRVERDWDRDGPEEGRQSGWDRGPGGRPVGGEPGPGRPPPHHGGGGGGGGGARGGGGRNPRVCMFFNTPGGCRKQNECKFLHITDDDDGGGGGGRGRGRGGGRGGGGGRSGFRG